ncbi:MAG: tRNA (N(6)-L-threonylcarbamoyladenosine(37)-C(2))-methylthiotransferase MtaB [Candidatus Bipolaricaulia bacterium]
MHRPRVAILTFGCRANQYESDAMRAALTMHYDVVTGEADAYVLNGCSVTQLAERKARQAARRLHRERPGAPVVLIGCIADAVQQGLTHFDEADLLAGSGWKGRIESVLSAALAGRRGALPTVEPTPLDGERTEGPQGRVRAFLRVQDGCSLPCSYCRPTQIRGPSRSKSIEAATTEARRLMDLGFPEIVLTGINLALYAPSDGRLHDLVLALLGSPDLQRLRIASINPAGLSVELLDAFTKDARLCPHFHVPLQSGDDRILAAMRRGYTAAEYEDRVMRILDRLPDATLGADLIVGFPGEDEAAFQATCALVSRLPFVNLHVFRYSQRPGTTAANLPERVPESIKRKRADRLDELWRPIRRRLLDNRIGTTQDVLVEERRDGRWRGYTRDYIFVSFDSTEEIPVGVTRTVRILATTEDRLEGVDDDRDRAG